MTFISYQIVKDQTFGVHYIQATHTMASGTCSLTIKNSLGIFRHPKRLKGIEPSYSEWQSDALPLCYSRIVSSMQSIEWPQPDLNRRTQNENLVSLASLDDGAFKLSNKKTRLRFLPEPGLKLSSSGVFHSEPLSSNYIREAEGLDYPQHGNYLVR